MSCRLLALDTSTEVLALALHVDGQCLTHQESGAALASQRLLAVAAALLAQAGLAWRQLDAIAFARGPGAFTGLRTACAAAQGLGLGLERPVLPIDSLLIVAEDARLAAAWPAGTPIWAALDARMDEIYAACWQFDDQRWNCLQAAALYAWPALAQRWAAQPPQAVAGNALTAFAGRLEAPRARQQAACSDRAAALGRLARRAWDDGQAVDAAQALPLYLRDKVALTTDERRQAGHAR